MAQFTFPLAGVLRHREHIEQERQRDLAAVQLQMTETQSELKALHASSSATTDDIRTNHLTGRLDMGYLTAHRRYMLGVQRQSAALTQKLAGLQQQADAARLALTEAAKQRKILEKLKEKQQKRWAEAQARREAADLDEVGMQLAYRNTTDNAEQEREPA